MVAEIQLLLNTLIEVRKYVIKLNKASRKGTLGQNKLTEANNLYELYQNELKIFNNRIKEGKLDKNTIATLHDICSRFDSVYKDILNILTLESDSETDEMENFDLKTACSLLPIMTGDEGLTQDLINNIELYDTMLKEEHKKHLINFVLKSRLSKSAKLRLSSTYSTVKDLVHAMKTQLLTLKSATSIQQQLNNIKQSSMTIEKFGSNIETLFVDLTISQSNGDEKTYAILRPINEKMATKRFSDGLRDSRLSTIIAARDYSSLKDAIRAAKDEELSSPPSTSGSGFVMQRGRGRGQEHAGRGKFQFQSRTYTNNQQQNQQFGHNMGQTYFNRPYRGGQQRGTFQRGGYNKGKNFRNINFLATGGDDTENNEEHESMNHFFRA